MGGGGKLPYINLLKFYVMKKLVSTLMIVSVFAVGLSAFNPVNVNAQQTGDKFLDDGDLCPCAGDQCLLIISTGGGSQR